MVKKSQKSVKSKRRINSLVALLVTFAFIGWLFLRANNKDSAIIPSKSPKNTASSGTNKTAASSPASSDTSTTSNSDKTAASGNNSSSGAVLLPPSGNFVSNHSPGGDNPTAETSVCNTTPGASCYVQFTKGSEVKKLDLKTTDATGAAYWYWDVNSAGLKSGSWVISAVATLGGQSKSTADSISLEVP